MDKEQEGKIMCCSLTIFVPTASANFTTSLLSFVPASWHCASVQLAVYRSRQYASVQLTIDLQKSTLSISTTCYLQKSTLCIRTTCYLQKLTLCVRTTYYLQLNIQSSIKYTFCRTHTFTSDSDNMIPKLSLSTPSTQEQNCFFNDEDGGKLSKHLLLLPAIHLQKNMGYIWHDLFRTTLTWGIWGWEEGGGRGRGTAKKKKKWDSIWPGPLRADSASTRADKTSSLLSLYFLSEVMRFWNIPIVMQSS